MHHYLLEICSRAAIWSLLSKEWHHWSLLLYSFLENSIRGSLKDQHQHQSEVAPLSEPTRLQRREICHTVQVRRRTRLEFFTQYLKTSVGWWTLASFPQTLITSTIISGILRKIYAHSYNTTGSIIGWPKLRACRLLIHMDRDRARSSSWLCSTLTLEKMTLNQWSSPTLQSWCFISYSSA